MRGIRGATTVATNTPAAIIEGVIELLTALQEANQFIVDDIGAVIFSSTPDLNAAFPAAAARQIGWTEVPLFGTQEIDQPDALAHCIRVLILLNTEKPQGAIRHVYLREASILRQDIVKR